MAALGRQHRAVGAPFAAGRREGGPAPRGGVDGAAAGGSGAAGAGSGLTHRAPGAAGPRRYPGKGGPGAGAAPGGAQSGGAGAGRMAGLRALWLLAAALGAAGGHPQPCRVPAPPGPGIGPGAGPGPTVRLGALLPPAPARARLRAALARAAGTGPGGGSGGVTLPHNLSLEVVGGGPAARDPGSLARWLCGALAGRGVAAVLALPRSRRELLQLDFLAAALQVPFVSILDTRWPLPFRAQVRPAAPAPLPSLLLSVLAGSVLAPVPALSVLLS